MKKIIYLFLLLSLLMISIKVKALNDIDVDVDSKYALLYNVTDDMMMYEKDSHKRIKIASMTKIMTAIVAIENIEDFNQKVTITDADYKNVYLENLAIVGFKIGNQATYEDLLYGLMFKSGADAAYALADNIAGSEENFVKLMNDKAQDLGLKDTKFTNVVGYDQDNYSTVYDTMMFFKYALKNEHFKEIISKDTYTTSDSTITLNNVIDDLINKYQINSPYSEYILGGKTGYTKEAKNCLASFAEYQGTTYIVVTADVESYKHIEDAIKLYTEVFDNYSRKKIINVDDYLVSVSSKKKNDIKVYSDEEVDVLLPNEASLDDVKFKYKGIKIIDDHIKKNDLLGHVNLEYNGKVIKTIDITYNKKLQKSMNYRKVSIPKSTKGYGTIIAITLTSIGGIILIFFMFVFISILIDIKNHKRKWKF